MLPEFKTGCIPEQGKTNFTLAHDNGLVTRQDILKKGRQKLDPTLDERGKRGEKPIRLFTPGPVMMHDFTLAEGARQVRYFRTREFSDLLLRCESLLLELLDAKPGSRVVVLTGSGTAAMEASIINCFDPSEQLLIINGGSFGERFVEICSMHSWVYQQVSVPHGRQLKDSLLSSYEGLPIRGVLINHHETSTGNLYDLRSVDHFCKTNNCFLVVDAIGSFLADPMNLKEYDIDVLILSSQKGLALPPGLSFLVLSPRMIDVISKMRPKSYYLNLRRYLQDMQRGQTPFTPAVGIAYQLKQMLEFIKDQSVSERVRLVETIARDFRQKIKGLPLSVFAESPSNALTSLEPTDGRRPQWYVSRLEEEYGIFVCPNGGMLAERIFRVGHLGNISVSDNTALVEAMKELLSRDT